MRQQWAYRVTVSTRDNDLEYEGRFVRFNYAQKAATRKAKQYKGTGAFVNIYSRWDGTCITKVA